MRLQKYFERPSVSTEVFQVSNEGWLRDTLTKIFRRARDVPNISLDDTKQSIETVKKTYLDNSWMANHRLRGGTVKLGKRPTFIADDPKRSWQTAQASFYRSVNGSLKRMRELDQAIAPAKAFLDSNEVSDGDEARQILKQCKAIQPIYMYGIQYPEGSEEKEVKALDEPGVKVASQLIVDLLSIQITNEDRVLPVYDKLKETWVGSDSVYRKKVAQFGGKSPQVQIVNTIAKLVEELPKKVDNDNYSNGFRYVRDGMVTDLALWLELSVK